MGYVKQEERVVRVHFAPLDASDETVINDNWLASVYFAVWQQVAQYEAGESTALKLVADEEQGNEILGLLRLGAALPTRSPFGKLDAQAVLETAPNFRYHSRDRHYQGIGKVLVARLIAESVMRGYEGALVVTPRPQSVAFYRHLGFQPIHNNPKRFFVHKESGRELLASVLV